MDSVIGTTVCSVTVIQNVLSGRTFNKLSVFEKFMAEITFLKVAEDNNYGVRVCPLHTQYLIGEHALYLLRWR